MRDHTIHDDSDGNISDDETSSLCSSSRPVQATKEWDVFTNNPPVIITGSMADQSCMQTSLKIVKILAYVFSFLLVLGGAVVSKGTMLFMTSQLTIGRTIQYCNQGAKQRQFVVTLPEVERVGWVWCLFFAYAVPELMSFVRSIRICFFKNSPKPTFWEFLAVIGAETLRAIGTGLLVFMVLPKVDVVKGAMITNCLCFVPALLSLFPQEVGKTGGNEASECAMYYAKLAINGVALAAQVTAFVVWPLLKMDESYEIWTLPVAIAFISVGWWENFFLTTKDSAMSKFLQRLRTTRHYTFMYVSLWKILVLFCTMLAIYFYEFNSVAGLFDLFTASFSPREIDVTIVKAYNDSRIPSLDALTLEDRVPMPASYNSALWVLLIHVLGSYFAYITGKFACRILIQGIGYALPVSITVPILITLLITLCGLRNGDPCYFKGSIPDYLFFRSPDYYLLDDFLVKEYSWIWLLWLLSQTWIALHIWMPKVDRLMATEVLFTLPMYESLFIDQSLAFNRRHDEGNDIDTKELDAIGNETHYNMKHDIDEAEATADKVQKRDHIRRVFACATMWHETPDEMMQMLKSIFRMDADQAARRLAQTYMAIVDPDYYEFEAHIFFDDAFEISEENDDDVVVNKFVKDLMATIDVAATEVHNTEYHLKPPKKIDTPYGGRLVWTLPGKTKLYAHLKNKDLIRHKKRWSQVMYMYYLLGHRLMELPYGVKRKEVIASNTFILALDGDIDFKPEAMHLLLDLMKKDPKLGAACGRIHPVGSGPMVWYQKFEYAIGHWLQKATEHVIGCVLCSPGCFSLFRGEALMDDAVMNKYTTLSNEARHYVQYDQGEDRWLCTLLLQRGYRVEYSAASDAYTHCPESFDEFYNQRRRWVPSTMANIMDLLMDYKRTVKVNNNISFLYILYQGLLMGGSILGPGNIFLMLVGAFVAAFKIDNWTSFLYNIVPILIYMFVCFVCESKIQLLAAKVISAVYGLVMMAVLVGIMLQINEDGPLAPSSLFFFVVAGEMIIAAFLHPQEFGCLPAGVVYYVTVPSMYLLLIVYSIFNLNVVSWGTREVAQKKTKLEMEKEKIAAEEEKKKAKKKPFWNFIQREKSAEEEEGSLEFSLAGLFKCMLCTHTKGGEEKVQLMRIADSLEKLSKRLEHIEQVVDPVPQGQQRRRTTRNFNKRDLDPLTEGEENDMDEDTDTYTENAEIELKEERDEQVTPYWIDHNPEMRKGVVDFLPSHEEQFWKDLIDKYLFVLEKNKDKEKEVAKELKDLRDISVFAFFMLNALFVLVIFLLQLSKDQLHINWPLGVKANITYDPDHLTITITKEYLELEPIGMLFILFFGVILIIQFIAMLFHRFGTLSHMLATTQINWFQSGTQSDDKDAKAREVVQVVKDLQKLRGADRVAEEKDPMQEEVGRRKTIQNLEYNKHLQKKRQSVLTLDTALKRRLSVKSSNPDAVPPAFRRLTVRRDTLNALTQGCITINNERRMTEMKRTSLSMPGSSIRSARDDIEDVSENI